jgi:hypothetical protein
MTQGPQEQRLNRAWQAVASSLEPDAVYRAIVEQAGALTGAPKVLLRRFDPTTDELRVATGDTSLNPGIDVWLTVLTCGLWSVYVEFRNVQKIHAVLVTRYPGRKDQSHTVLILFLASLLVGVTWLVASFIVQEEFNALARESQPRSLAG